MTSTAAGATAGIDCSVHAAAAAAAGTAGAGTAGAGVGTAAVVVGRNTS